MSENIIDDLILAFCNFPGISKKQAEKLVYGMIVSKRDHFERLSLSIDNAINKIKNCKNCGFISEKNICSICDDKTRKKTLIVVENSLDVIKMEKSNSINAFYHVLDGLVDLKKGIDYEHLNIESLKQRSPEFNEIIIALSPNMEGILTTNFLKKILKNKKVTQLAQGLPLGAAMEYIDELTLKAALENRKDVE